MLKDIVIIGAGGVGRETALIIEDINNVNKEWNLIGFVDDNDNIQNTKINDYDVIGKLDYLLNYEKEVYVVCAIANYNVKKSWRKEMKDKIKLEDIFDLIDIEKTFEQTIEYDLLKLMQKLENEKKDHQGRQQLIYSAKNTIQLKKKMIMI